MINSQEYKIFYSLGTGTYASISILTKYIIMCTCMHARILIMLWNKIIRTVIIYNLAAED